MKVSAGLSGPMRLGSRGLSNSITNLRPNPRLAVRRSKNSPTIRAALDFSAAPVEVLIGGGALVVTTAGYLIYEALKAQKEQQGGRPASQAGAPKAAPLPRENACLVFGASGRTGRQVVAELLKAGRTVIAAVRDETRAKEAFSSMGISVGRQSSGSGGILFLETNVDVTNPVTLTSSLFKGATQVVCTLGPVFGRTADGNMGYLDGMTSEKVDKDGVSNIAAAAAKFLTPARRTVVDILPMKTAEDLAKWQRLDDVIMGGNSASGLVLAADGSGAVWKGELVVEGGGFCGARTQQLDLDLSKYDGITLRVKANGQTLKLNIKTDKYSEPEDTLQASFETNPNGDWTTVFLPWHVFVPVKRARSVPGGAPLDPKNIKSFGLVYSRFSYNGFANPEYAPGPFEIQFDGGIRAYTAPRPQLLLVSSAGVERNAKIGNDEEARKKDIPIVQLNPGGTLNYKYDGEVAVRSSGLSYAVVRPTGMSDDAGATASALLEASQGDRISGKVARSDVAALVAAAVNLPSAANKTFEVRRSEAADAQGKPMTAIDNLRLFLGLVVDSSRQNIGLEPFPAPAPPPPPPSEERKGEILADPRVQAAQDRNAGGRVRTEKETTAAGNVAIVDDGRAEASASPAGGNDGDNKAAAEKKERASKDVPENVSDAREWIRRWRAKNLEQQLPQGLAAGVGNKA